MVKREDTKPKYFASTRDALIFWFIIGGIFVTIGLVSYFSQHSRPATATPRTLNTEQFTILWTKSDADIRRRNYEPAFLHIRENCLLLINAYRSLQCLNTATGELVWQSPIKLGGPLISNESTVFIPSHEQSDQDPLGEFTPQRDKIKITAYDIGSGQIKWSEIYRGMTSVWTLSADETTLVVSGGGWQGSYDAVMTIDAETGSLVEYEEIDDNFFQRARREDPVFQMPVEKDTVISNFAVLDGIVYFLTADVMLWAVNEATGTVLATARFEPAQAPIENLRSADFYIAVGEGKVFVYLYDSKQLFALEPGF